MSFSIRRNPLVNIPIPWILGSPWRLALALMLTLAIPLGLLGLLLTQQYGQAVQQEAIAQNKVVTALAGTEAQEHFEHLMSALRGLASNSAVISAIQDKNTTAIERPFSWFLKNHSTIDRLQLVDENGLLIFNYPTDSTGKAPNLSFRDWFLHASYKKTPYVSGVYQRLESPRIYVVGIATPVVTPEGKIIGYLNAQEPVSALAKMIEHSEIESDLVLIDQYGMIITDREPLNNPPHQYGEFAWARDLVGHASGSIQGEDPTHHENSLLEFRRLPIGWMVIASQPTQSVYEPVSSFARRLWLILLSMFAITFFAALFWLNAVRRYHESRQRLEQLTQWHADEVSRTPAAEEPMALVAALSGYDFKDILNSIDQRSKDLTARTEHLLDKKSRTELHELADTAKYLARILSELHDFSEAATGDLHLRRLDLNRVVDLAMSRLRTKIIDSHAQIEVEKLPPITADEEMMARVFTQLIDNAINYTKPGRAPHITIKGREVGNEYIQIIVHDDGTGMPEEEIHVLFKPLSQLTQNNDGKEIGLGLPYCKEVITRHRGNITVKSGPANGTTFLITLPIEGSV
jgi:signal transduction histidine kinase